MSAEGGFDAPCPTITQEIWTELAGPAPAAAATASPVATTRVNARLSRRSIDSSPSSAYRCRSERRGRPIVTRVTRESKPSERAQNFRHIPELGWPFGHWWAWAWIVATTIAQLAFFRWKRWI
jgi:hypothetical protein